MSNLYNIPLYKKFVRPRHFYANELIRKYDHLLKWKPNESILDVGCGTGSLSHMYIYPLLPKDFTRYVCTDISSAMIQEAEKEFSGIPKVQFDILDITGEVEDKKCSFDHIFSVHCLMWISNQRMAFQNIYDMLKPGGGCFLIFSEKHFTIDIIYQLSTRQRWKKFFTDFDEMYPFPYRHEVDSVQTITDMMKLIGYINIKVYLEKSNFVFNEEEHLGVMKSIPNPMALMTPEEQDDYLKESVELARDLKLIQETAGDVITGTFLVVYGEK